MRALVAYVASLGQGPRDPGAAPGARHAVARACGSSPSTAPAATRSSAQGGYVTGARVPPLARRDADADRRGGADRAVPDAAVLEARDPRPRSSTRSSRYVQYAKHPGRRGGWAIGHIGPVPEGIVTWLLAARRARRRLRRDREEARGREQRRGLARRGGRAAARAARPASARARGAARIVPAGAPRPRAPRLVVLVLLGSRVAAARSAFIVVYALDRLAHQTQFLGLALGLALRLPRRRAAS